MLWNLPTAWELGAPTLFKTTFLYTPLSEEKKRKLTLLLVGDIKKINK